MPGPATAQRQFRAAAVLLTDSDHPDAQFRSESRREAVSVFVKLGRGDKTAYNYSEATGGRASIEMGDLSKFLKAHAGWAARPASCGNPPPDSYRRPGGESKSFCNGGEPQGKRPERDPLCSPRSGSGECMGKRRLWPDLERRSGVRCAPQSVAAKPPLVPSGRWPDSKRQGRVRSSGPTGQSAGGPSE